jgi:hypothetical protein
MNVDTGAFTALRDQVDALERQVADLAAEAFIVREIGETMIRVQTGRPAPAARPRRIRHLRALDGGRS